MRVISNIFIIDLQILKYILISNNNFIIIFLYKLVNIYNVLYSSHSQTAGRRSCNWLLSLSLSLSRYPLKYKTTYIFCKWRRRRTKFWRILLLWQMLLWKITRIQYPNCRLMGRNSDLYLDFPFSSYSSYTVMNSTCDEQ